MEQAEYQYQGTKSTVKRDDTPSARQLRLLMVNRLVFAATKVYRGMVSHSPTRIFSLSCSIFARRLSSSPGPKCRSANDPLTHFAVPMSATKWCRLRGLSDPRSCPQSSLGWSSLNILDRLAPGCHEDTSRPCGASSTSSIPADFIIAAFALAWSLDSTHTPNVATELDLMTLFKPLSRLKSEGTKYLHVLKAPNRLTAQQRYHS